MPVALLLVALAAAPKIAVLDLEATGVPPELAESVGLVLPSEVRQLSPKSSVISGGEIRAILGFERQKQVLGCADDSCTAELGGALGVDEMVSGRIGRVGSIWVLELRRSDVKRARTIASAARTVKSEDGLIDAVRSAAAELFPSAASSAPQAAVQVAPTETVGRTGGSSNSSSWVMVGGGAALTAAGIVGIAYGNSEASQAKQGTVDRGSFETAKTIYFVSWPAAIVGAGLAVFGGYRILAAPAPGGASLSVGGRF